MFIHRKQQSPHRTRAPLMTSIISVMPFAYLCLSLSYLEEIYKQLHIYTIDVKDCYIAARYVSMQFMYR